MGWGEKHTEGRIRWVEGRTKEGVGGKFSSRGEHDDEEEAVIRGKLGGVKF